MAGSERLAVLRRDVRMVIGGLIGKAPPVLVERRPSPVYPEVRAVSAGGSAARARSVEVIEVRRETRDAVSLVLAEKGAFVPGQFLTVLVTVGGEVLRRAYSISSAVGEPMTITVKRMPGGRVSTHLVEQARAGMRLQVLGPSGDFTVATEAAAARHVVAIAGGSGITPIMAIARAVLADEPASRVTVLYGNRDAASIIFGAELARMAATYGGRLIVDHVLDVRDGVGGDAGAGGGDADTGGDAIFADAATAGRLDAAMIGARLERAAPAAEASYYVCGPEAMMAEARVALAARGVEAARVREERFTAPARREASQTRVAQPVTIRRAGVSLDVIVPPGATILDAGLAAGVPMSLSCAMGGCGACAVRLTAGEVAMDEPNCLTDAERAGGTILACCARPLGPCTVEATP